MFKKIKSFFGKGQKTQKPASDYPKVTSRKSLSDDEWGASQVNTYLENLNVLAAKFPFETYQVIDNIALLDPYVSKYVHTTIALGNVGHNPIDMTRGAHHRPIMPYGFDIIKLCQGGLGDGFQSLPR